MVFGVCIYVAVGSRVQYCNNQLRLEGPSFICAINHGTRPVMNTKQYIILQYYKHTNIHNIE